MTIIQTRSRLQSIFEIWFFDNKNVIYDEIIKMNNIDTIIFKNSLVKVNEKFKSFRCGIIDLSMPENEIFGRFDRDFRNNIRRAEKEGMHYVECQSGEFEVLYDSYIKFSKNKNITFIPKSILLDYFEQNAFFASKVVLDGIDLQYHFYFVDSCEVILLASFQNQFLTKEIKSQTIGWANRFLHWKDILNFKRNGLLVYNLEGVGNPITKENENIVKFKMEMNPEIKTYYNATLQVSMKGKILYWMKNVFK